MDEKMTELVKEAMMGNASAFTQLMELKARQIIYISVKMMRSQPEGERVAQESMLEMYQNIKDLKKPEDFQSWMYKIIIKAAKLGKYSNEKENVIPAYGIETGTDQAGKTN